MSIEEQITEAVQEAFASAMEERDEAKTEAGLRKLAERTQPGLDLWRAYSAEEAGEIIGLSRSRVYDLPEEELRPTWTGPAKGRKRYLGINILCYLAGIEPVDVEDVARQARERFLAEAKPPAQVKPLSGDGGKKRVL